MFITKLYTTLLLNWSSCFECRECKQVQRNTADRKTPLPRLPFACHRIRSSYDTCEQYVRSVRREVDITSKRIIMHNQAATGGLRVFWGRRDGIASARRRFIVCLLKETGRHGDRQRLPTDEHREDHRSQSEFSRHFWLFSFLARLSWSVTIDLSIPFVFFFWL